MGFRAGRATRAGVVDAAAINHTSLNAVLFSGMPGRSTLAPIVIAAFTASDRGRRRRAAARPGGRLRRQCSTLTASYRLRPDPHDLPDRTAVDSDASHGRTRSRSRNVAVGSVAAEAELGDEHPDRVRLP
jgi:hypothetical protein